MQNSTPSFLLLSVVQALQANTTCGIIKYNQQCWDFFRILLIIAAVQNVSAGRLCQILRGSGTPNSKASVPFDEGRSDVPRMDSDATMVILSRSTTRIYIAFEGIWWIQYIEPPFGVLHDCFIARIYKWVSHK